MCEPRIKIPSAMSFTSDGQPAVVMVMSEAEAGTVMLILNLARDNIAGYVPAIPGLDLGQEKHNVLRVWGALVAAMVPSR
jgi:hypothetical protein